MVCRTALSRRFAGGRVPLERIGTPALSRQIGSVLDFPGHIPGPIEGRKAERRNFRAGTMAESSQQMVILAAVQPIATRHHGIDFGTQRRSRRFLRRTSLIAPQFIIPRVIAGQT